MSSKTTHTELHINFRQEIKSKWPTYDYKQPDKQNKQKKPIHMVQYIQTSPHMSIESYILKTTKRVKT